MSSESSIRERAIRDHQAWLGFLQPDGLVVSPAALYDAQVVLDTRAIDTQERFSPFVESIDDNETDTRHQVINDFSAFCRDFLEWPDDCLHGVDPERPLPDSLTIPLPELGEILSPSFAFRDLKPKDSTQPWLLLVKSLDIAADLDAVTIGDQASWSASATRRFERLLRETKVPIGLLFNGTHIRLVYAPKGENAGSLTFPVGAMTEVAGRPILAALHELLSAYRLLAAPSEARLPALLQRSRDYQSTVSTELARQVIDAAFELLRGFQAADERTRGELLKAILAENPNQVYQGLLTVLLRLVFVLYAEDRGLMPGGSLYQQNYSIRGLFERLRADHERYPDTMDSRFGAWAQLLALFRAIHGGCNHPLMKLPARRGYLFDPDRYPWLEGRASASAPAGRLPLVPDGTFFRVLRKLLILNGERLSYKTLDVEQIGSVYEVMMGFGLRLAEGPSIAIKPKKPHGAPVPINLEELLAQPGGERAKWLKKATDQELIGDAAASLKSARSVDDLLAALEKRVARSATPAPVPTGGMILVPSDERRRSGSNYTPRKLTEPIVRKTLEPILKRLGDKPTPQQLLDLKICDMACGSGAFMVEASRQLGDELVKAWHVHNCVPKIPPDEDELLHARRVIAQRCLYGVDKNPMAVDLAKLSLWLATLAKDHPFTFLDHSLRAGDSLVGLTRQQIADFHWDRTNEKRLGQEHIEERIIHATRARKEILDAGDAIPPELKAQKLRLADDALDSVRLFGDLCIAAFFAGDNEKQRKAKRDEYLDRLAVYLENGDIRQRPTAQVEMLRNGESSVIPFHWEIEFPEVFSVDARGNPAAGFDAIMGNPPFLGGSKISSTYGTAYLDWLLALHEESHGNADLVAHFFRRSFNLLRVRGTIGLIATNTIGQGDTRSTGLRWICLHGGTIYDATRRKKWPGLAAVVISVVHAHKGPLAGSAISLDGRPVPIITAYLFHAGVHDDPACLLANAGRNFLGSKIYGQGFIFDDTASDGLANSQSVMNELIAKNPRNAERIFPYIGGEEVNDGPTHLHCRYVINFGQISLEEAQRWPDLLRIVREKVKPERDRLREDTGPGAHGKKWWWQFQHPRQPLYASIAGLKRVLVISQVTSHVQFAFLPARMVFSHALNVFPLTSYAAFCALQSVPHEVWTRFFASSLEDRLRYTPTDCFETFPFPERFENNTRLEATGKTYYEFRAALMVRNDEGLTKTYNRFHDPNETASEITRLRELHAAMDRAVLDAYGWTDIRTDCEFLLDYEDDEDEGEPSPQTASKGRGRKKPWRYRWPDDVRDDVLARLLALNAKRAEQERLSGGAAKGTIAKPKKAVATPVREPEYSLFDAAYPATDTDRAICAASLSAIEQTAGLASIDHLDVLLLATHRDWCKELLSTVQQKKLDRAVKNVPAALFVDVGQSIKWKECRDYLELRKAIRVEHDASEQLISPGPKLAATKSEFPITAHDVVALALVALRELHTLKRRAASATKEQRKLLAAFEQQEKAFGLLAS